MIGWYGEQDNPYDDLIIEYQKYREKKTYIIVHGSVTVNTVVVYTASSGPTEEGVSVKTVNQNASMYFFQ